MMEYPFDFESTEHRVEPPVHYGAKFTTGERFSAVYDVKFVQDRLEGQLGNVMTMQAMALYWYARFDGDRDLSASVSVPKITRKLEPASGRDHFKMWVMRRYDKINHFFWRLENRARKKFKAGYPHKPRIGKRYIPRWPKRWEYKTRSFDVITFESWDIHIERLQESLLAQIWFLTDKGIEPQAVLAHPEIAHKLIAVPGLDKYRPYGFNVATSGRFGEFAGIRVIECPEMKWGAIVV